MTDQDLELIGKTIAGRYLIKGLIGSGGMGAVYRAEQHPLKREVALKVIRPTLVTDHESMERFKLEAQTVSRLLHPNVVTVYDFGSAENGLLYIAMECLPGQNLRERLSSQGAIPWCKTLAIVRDISSGLEAAHQLGVIHRDLKPDNIMLIDLGRKDFVKILDFGVAKLIEPKHDNGHVTSTGMLVGTPGYMSPEQVLKGITTDLRSDLYAVGVLWFEMLTGTTLFKAATPVALVMKHATEPVPFIEERIQNANVPEPIERLMRTLLSKEPDDRPERAQVLVEKLELLMRYRDEIPDDPFSTGVIRSAQAQGTMVKSRTDMEATVIHRDHEATVVQAMVSTEVESDSASATAPTPETGSLAFLPEPLPNNTKETDVVNRSPPAPLRVERSPIPLVIAASLLFVLVVGGVYLLLAWNQQDKTGESLQAKCETKDAQACLALQKSASSNGEKREWATKACEAGSASSCAALIAKAKGAEKVRLSTLACADGKKEFCNSAGGVHAEATKRKAKLEDAKLENAKLENAKLEDAKLEDAKLEDAKLEDAKESQAQLDIKKSGLSASQKRAAARRKRIAKAKAREKEKAVERAKAKRAAELALKKANEEAKRAELKKEGHVPDLILE